MVLIFICFRIENNQPQKRTLQQDQQFLAERSRKKSSKQKKIVVSPEKQLKVPIKGYNSDVDEEAQGTPYTSDLISKLVDLSLSNAAEIPTHAYQQSNSQLAASVESVLPILHLQLWNNQQQKLNMLTYIPSNCPLHKVHNTTYIYHYSPSLLIRKTQSATLH